MQDQATDQTYQVHFALVEAELRDFNLLVFNERAELASLVHSMLRVLQDEQQKDYFLTLKTIVGQLADAGLTKNADLAELLKKREELTYNEFCQGPLKNARQLIDNFRDDLTALEDTLLWPHQLQMDSLFKDSPLRLMLEVFIRSWFQRIHSFTVKMWERYVHDIDLLFSEVEKRIATSFPIV